MPKHGKQPTAIMVLGIGNLLLGDDGVGVHAAQALGKETLPEGVEVLDVGTAFLDALPAIEKADRLIVLDAMQADGTPGTIYRISLDRCGGPTVLHSLHGIDIFRMLELAGNQQEADVIVFGVEPAQLDWSMELSPSVSKALPSLLKAVREEIMENR